MFFVSSDPQPIRTPLPAAALAGRSPVLPVAIALLALVSACAGPSSAARDRGGGKSPAAAAPERWSSSASSGAPVAESAQVLPGTSSRCKDGVCTCRPIDDLGRGADAAADPEDPPPPAGTKRFELRTGRGLDDYRITVDGLGTFRKTGDNPEPACIYVDLPPGPHRVRYHVVARSAQAGVQPRLRIGEYAQPFRLWYRTFAFRCGGTTGPCTKDDADDALRELGKVKGGKHDPCGSTRVQGLRFYTDQPPDAAVADFNLQLVLNVYRFTPRFPPDASHCSGPSYDAGKSSGAASEADDPGAGGGPETE